MKKEPNYIIIFIISILITLLVHYLFISKFNLPSTLHVFIGLMILWIALAVTSALIPKR